MQYGPLQLALEKEEILSLGRISSWHITMTFPFDRGEGWLPLSFSLFIPKRGYAVAELRSRVMFTCSTLCHHYPFCSFLLIKALKSPVPSIRLQRLCDFLQMNLAVIFYLFWTTVDMRQCLHYFSRWTAGHSYCSTWTATFIILLNSVIWHAFALASHQ